MERFAKLNAKVVDPNSSGGGGKPGQSAQIDTAHGMRDIPPAAFYLANLKFGNGGAQDQAQLLERLYDALRDQWATERNPKRRGKGVWNERIGKALVRTALAEFIEDPKCRRCKGNKTVPPHDADCPKCGGTGQRRWPAAKVIRGVGISYGDFKRTWQPRYRVALGILAGWEAVAITIYRANNPREEDVRSTEQNVRPTCE